MSVPEHRRQENKFEVLNQTRDLAAYTAHILSNENVFDRKYQWLINKTNNLGTDMNHGKLMHDTETVTIC